MSHLENLLIEYYSWQGCVVRHNEKVGSRPGRGGWEMELDVIAYDVKKGKITHLEPSLDADSWSKREARFTKKFEAGRKHIPKIFPWAPSDVKIEQVAILISAGATRRRLAGAEVVTIDEMISRIQEDVRAKGIASRAAISEQYPLLRTIQFIVSGYYGVKEASDKTPPSIN